MTVTHSNTTNKGQSPLHTVTASQVSMSNNLKNLITWNVLCLQIRAMHQTVRISLHQNHGDSIKLQVHNCQKITGYNNI